MMTFRDFIEDMAVYFYGVHIIRKLFAPVFHWYNRRSSTADSLKALKENFDLHALEVLQIFDKTMRENNYKYSLAFGTMLGAVREHGFIKHDLDIDTFVWHEDFSEEMLCRLEDVGFRRTHQFLVDGGDSAREDTIELNGVQIDLFHIFPALPDRRYPYCCDFITQNDCRSRRQSMRKHGGLLPRRLEIPVSKETIMVPFEGMELPIIANAHEFLSFRYGEDYMTPQPRWRNGANPYIIDWEEKLAEYYEFH